MFPYLRADERPKNNDSRPREGVRITFPDNVQHWFPGPLELALSLAERMVPDDLFNHPGTTVEFGERSGTLFTVRKLIRGPQVAPPRAEGPAVIAPE